MGEILLTAREAVQRVANLNGFSIDIKAAATRATPDHAHWEEQTLPNGELFQTMPQFRRWALTLGIPHVLKAAALRTPAIHKKIDALYKKSGNEIPNSLNFLLAVSSVYTAYFKHYGIEALVGETIFGDFNPRSGALVLSDPGLPHWDPENTARLFPEVDYQITFQAPNASEAVNGDLRDFTGINLNTTKINGPIHSFHAVGLPYGKNTVRPTIATGEFYLQRLDKYLRSLGLEKGVDDIRTDSRSVRQLEALEAAAMKTIDFQVSNKQNTS